METTHDTQSQKQLVSSEQDLVLFSRDPAETFKEAELLVQLMSRRCSTDSFVANINGKQYPKVEWWATIGASLGLFPQVVYSRRLDRANDEIAYEARVEVVHHHGSSVVVSAGEALCSNRETRWQHADEYALKSMAITRATGKAYRIPLSFLAVMAGLEPTPSEEMPYDPAMETQSTESPLNRSHAGGKDHTAQSQSSSTGNPATQKQINRILGILDDERVTVEERSHVNDLVWGDKPFTKAKAGEVLDYFLGRSEFHQGEWIKTTAGVLEAR